MMTTVAIHNSGVISKLTLSKCFQSGKGSISLTQISICTCQSYDCLYYSPPPQKQYFLVVCFGLRRVVMVPPSLGSDPSTKRHNFYAYHASTMPICWQRPSANFDIIYTRRDSVACRRRVSCLPTLDCITLIKTFNLLRSALSSFMCCSKTIDHLLSSIAHNQEICACKCEYIEHYCKVGLNDWMKWISIPGQ